MRWHISTYAYMLICTTRNKPLGWSSVTTDVTLISHVYVVSLRRCGVASSRRCGVAALHRRVVASLRRCVVASLRGCVVAWLLRCVVASLRRCIVASLHRCIVAPLHRCGFASLRRWALASLMSLGRSFAKNLPRQHSYGSCTDTDAVQYQALSRKALPKTSAAA